MEGGLAGVGYWVLEPQRWAIFTIFMHISANSYFKAINHQLKSV